MGDAFYESEPMLWGARAVTVYWSWFYCQHHLNWERWDSPCLLAHEDVRVEWGDDAPCVLYRDGKLLGRFGVARRWKPCDDCASKSAEPILTERRDEAGLRA